VTGANKLIFHSTPGVKRLGAHQRSVGRIRGASCGCRLCSLSMSCNPIEIRSVN
jgi:hypothetical protein